MKLNLPNTLTLLRIVLTPVFLLMFAVPTIPYHYLWALIIFIVASVTDALDGHIARSRNMVTNFGKFTDPLADKMLTTAGFLGLMVTGYCNIWIVFFILFREFGVSSIRLVAASQGIVIPAGILGKVKTATMMVVTPLVIFLMSLKDDFGILPANVPLATISNILLGVCCLLAVVSGVKYIVDGGKMIDFSK